MKRWWYLFWRSVVANKIEVTLLVASGLMLVGLLTTLFGVVSLEKQLKGKASQDVVIALGETLQDYSDAVRHSFPERAVPQIVQPTPEEIKKLPTRIGNEKPRIVVRSPSRSPTPTPSPSSSPRVIVKTRKVYIRRPTPKPFFQWFKGTR